MDTTIETHYYDQYQSGIEIQFQQKVNRLMPIIGSIESQDGEFQFHDRMGTAGKPRKRTTRHTDVEYSEQQYDRRGIFTEEFYDAILLDNMDKVRLLTDPTNVYTTNFMYAMMRQMEDTIIAAATGTADVEENRTKSTVEFPSTQVVPVDYVRSGTTSNSGLTKDKIIRARDLLIEKEVVAPEEEIYGVVSNQELNDLLYIDEYKSADYHTQKALVDGLPVKWLGINWIRSERLLRDSSNYRRCLFMPTGAIKFAMRGGMTSSIDVLPQKHFAAQIYLKAEFGAVRTWEEKVVEVKSVN